MKNIYISLLASVSILLLFSACGSSPDQVYLTPIKTSTLNWTPEVTIKVNTTAPKIISTIVPTQTFQVKCPPINPDLQFEFTTEFAEFDASILNYLNNGGDPYKIETKFSQQGQEQYFSAIADFDGDTQAEVVVGTGDYLEEQGKVHIFDCDHNNYQLVKLLTPKNMAYGGIEFITEIFPSKPPFLIIHTYPISGWGQDFLAIGWYGEDWKIIHLASGSTPSEIVLIDQDMDGTKEVNLRTRLLTSPGAGISREIIDLYDWNGEEFDLIKSDIPPTDFRIHYLQDGEKEWEQGNPLLAIYYFEIAARNDLLENYSTNFERINNQTVLSKPYQQSFAFFRIIALWTFLDRPDLASKYIEEMSDEFPEGLPGNEFVQAVQELTNWYKNEADYKASCKKAGSYLDSQFPNIVADHIGDWGWSNPEYELTADICNFEN